MSKNGLQLASDLKYYLDYSRWIEDENRSETWEDSVDRVMNMHKVKYAKYLDNPRFMELFNEADNAYKEKLILGSQRALQFGGEPMLKHETKMYNCVGGYIDKIRSFQEVIFFLLNGCGLGFSVQYRHISKLPMIGKREKGVKTFVVPDSIEGWSDAFGILISSYVSEEGKSSFPEYEGYEIRFDLSLIRPEGSMISGGFKAPGPEGLRKSLIKCEELLEKNVNQNIVYIKPIVAYDYIMHMADAVLSGGVRRSATICFFNYDDDEMMNAKTGNWYYENPQRARSNNSVILNRNETNREQFSTIFKSIKEFGEPGFLFVNDYDEVSNPCVEIRFFPKLEDGRTGWQGCNLTEGNGAACTTEEKFYDACRSLAILGTLQAGYTDFKYIDSATKELFEREALLGCSFTGWMANPHIMMNPEVQKKGAEIIIEINKELSKIIEINEAARTTTCKPAGNSSVILKSPSGCHGDHSPKHFRCMQINKFSEIGKYLEKEHPYLIEESVWSSNKTDHVAFIPIVANKNAKFKKDLIGLNQLEVVKTLQNNWVEYGTNHERNIKPFLRHSVSNTVELDYSDYDNVENYLFENRYDFAAVSFLPLTGDKDYNQAPFTSVLTSEELLEKYGDASLFASGLIVDGLHAFDGNLWEACDYVFKRDLTLQGTRVQALIKKDWIRRAKQFAKRFFKGDIKEMILCLKDIHLYHKWVRINRELKQRDFNFETAIKKPEYVNMDTMGAIACSGPNGSCDIDPNIMAAMRSSVS
jgi:ribonucleoside-triphosphate reductase (thioredoxin)